MQLQDLKSGIKCVLAASLLLIIGVSSPGAADIFEYDDLGRLEKVTYPDGSYIDYIYDAAGNRVSKVTAHSADFPQAVDDAQGTGEDVPLTFDPRTNDSDPNGDPISITASSGTANGAVTFTPTSVTYSSNANWNGADTFTYTISDGNGGSDTATVVVTVNPVNDAPVAMNDSAATFVGEAITFDPLVNDTDIDGDALSVTAVTNGTNGTASLVGNSIVYTPNASFDGSDSVTYTVSDGNGGSDTASVSISVSIAATFAVSNASASEGGDLMFTVTRGANTSASNSVSYTTSTGTAGSGDFSARSGSLTFAIGETTKTVTVPSVEDTIYEASEVFHLDLYGESFGSVIIDDSGDGTITNDDAGPAFSVNNVSASEGNSATFTITKTGATEQSHNVSYTTTSGSAGGGGVDYSGRSGLLTFAPGEPSKTILVPTIEEAIYELSEVFYLDLSTATNNATISDSRGNGTITNDDAAPTFSITNASVSEGGTLQLSVVKTGATSQSHSIYYSTASGSAGTSDYTYKSGLKTFGPTNLYSSVYVPTTEDGLFESNEVMYVNLSLPGGGATISDSQGVGTILNDDAAPVANNDGFTYEGGSGWAYLNLTSNDTDADGQALTITSVSTPTMGQVALYNASTVKFYAAALLDGIGSFTYTISDGNLGTDTASVSVTIYPNDPGGGGGGPGAPR